MHHRSLAILLVGLVLTSGDARAGSAAADTIRVLDIAGLRLAALPVSRPPDRTVTVDILVAGGGLGGVAAALAACDAGRTVLLSEETSWLGGQATSQGVAALDDNGWADHGGATARYQAFREGVRDWYRRHRAPDPQRGADPLFNPGGAWASRLCFEPAVGVAVIDSLLAPHRRSGRLLVLTRHKPCRARAAGDRVRDVDLLDLAGGALVRVRAALFLDATELGDLLPLCGAEHVVGAEGRDETGEPHARAAGPDPDCVQAFTYPIVVEFRPGEDHRGAVPPDYERWRREQPFLPYFVTRDARGRERRVALRMFTRAPGTAGSFWRYRRLVDSAAFTGGHYPHDVSLLNWPANDYRGGSLLTGDAAAALGRLREARRLSLAFLHWLRTEMPRNDGGGRGYPELALRSGALGTADGLAMHPYVRESRRIRAVTTLREQDVAAALVDDPIRARFFDDAVAVGFYRIDLHPGPCGEPLLIEETLPFQIPLGALIPVRVENLVAAGKTLGVTHVTAACTRLHPIEWAVGEAAGTLAGLCLAADLSPRAAWADSTSRREVQRRLVAAGAPIYWLPSLPTGSPCFAEAQLAPFLSAERRAEMARSLRYECGQ
ncbi:MAG: FAD-dependent oxidoreductase [Candidatus Krumholzibacteriota bacterium]|nr:FAD-dependent oxidoreductase [Candidatus Krumholzibacteriota bacterium]